MPSELIVIFLLFFAVLAFGWFYLQRAKTRNADVVQTAAAPTADVPAHAPASDAAAPAPVQTAATSTTTVETVERVETADPAVEREVRDPS